MIVGPSLLLLIELWWDIYGRLAHGCMPGFLANRALALPMGKQFPLVTKH